MKCALEQRRRLLLSPLSPQSDHRLQSLLSALASSRLSGSVADGGVHLARAATSANRHLLPSRHSVRALAHASGTTTAGGASVVMRAATLSDARRSLSRRVCALLQHATSRLLPSRPAMQPTLHACSRVQRMGSRSGASSHQRTAGLVCLHAHSCDNIRLSESTLGHVCHCAFSCILRMHSRFQALVRAAPDRIQPITCDSL